MMRFSLLKPLLLLPLLFLLAVKYLNAQQSDHERMMEELEAIPIEPPEPVDSPEAVDEDDGKFQFYFIETVRNRNRPQLFVQTDAGFERIMPSFGNMGPLHRLNDQNRIFFYQRTPVEVDGQQSWEYSPRYSVSLQGNESEKFVVFLPQSSASNNASPSDVRALRWVELSRQLSDFGEIAIVNPFEQAIAIQLDGENRLLEPGQSYKSRFRILRRETGAVHLRIAVRFVDGDFREMFNTRVFIFENWRGILIPYFDSLAGELSLITIREQPDA